MTTETIAITIRIPTDLERCATEYAKHHDLRSRNAAINLALDVFFTDQRTPAEREQDAAIADWQAQTDDMRRTL